MTNVTKKYPDFFKVFLPGQHYERMLIPNAFVKLTRSQGRVVEDFILRDRNGRVWHVKARPIGDKLYFDDGWKRFREENSLKAGDFIVFTHVGSVVFKFKILELSSRCEKIKDEEEKNNMMESEVKEEQEQDEDGGDGDGDDDDDDDDDDYIDDEEEEDIEIEEENKGKYKGNMRSKLLCRACKARDIGSSSLSKAADPELEDSEIDAEMYVQEGNPYFVAKLLKNRPNELHVPKNVIKDFPLRFPEKIALLCCQCQGIQRNEVEACHLDLAPKMAIRKKPTQGRGKVFAWKDGRVCIRGWAGFCTRSKIKENDMCICEIVLREDQTIEMLRVHVARKE